MNTLNHMEKHILIFITKILKPPVRCILKVLLLNIYFYHTALDCGTPPCLNNTLAIIIPFDFEDIFKSNDVTKYVCSDMYAFPGDLSIKNTTCKIEVEEGAETKVYARWDWNDTEDGTCECKIF